MTKRLGGLLVVVVSFLVSHATAEETLASRDERMRWWRDARFGMFVHWGLYSIPAGQWGERKWTRGGVEWIQQRAGVPADEYEQKLVPQFKPKPDFAAEWARVARSAGCRYLVFTSKHHEGFALHDSALTTFDAKDACGRDLFKEIVDAARTLGLRVGAYHSVIDWHHPHAYAGFGLPTIRGVTNEGRDNSIYVDYLHGQVREIVTGYGPIDILWWDYSQPQCQGESWRAAELIAMVRKHQPRVVMNNRLYRSLEAGWPKDWSQGFTIDPKYGDFCTPEQHIPPTGMPGVDWETCMTMNTSWGYNQHDHAWKPSGTLIHNLVDIASKGGNYLLNIGPKADGSVPEETVERMAAIGRWMTCYGVSIYGTTASLFPHLPWGRSTTQALDNGGTRLYLQVFEWPQDGVLVVPGLASTPSQAELLTPDGAKNVPVQIQGTRAMLTLPKRAIDDDASVIALTFASRPEISEPRIGAMKDGVFRLKAADAVLKGGRLGLERKADDAQNIGFWTDAASTVTFKIHVEKPGRYKVDLAHACPADAGGEAVLSGGDSELRFEIPSTGDWTEFGNFSAGNVIFGRAGARDLLIRAVKIKGIALMNLREVVLKPVP